MFLWYVLPAIMFWRNLRKPRPRNAYQLYGATVLTGFVLAVSAAWAADVDLKNQMDSFDLNGDGSIDGYERTPEAQRVMDDWASDTGRTMVIFLGLPVSAIWYGLCFPVLYFGKWLVQKAFRNSTH